MFLKKHKCNVKWIKHDLHYNYFFLLFNSLQMSLVSKDEKLVIKVSINSNHIKNSPYRDSLITNPKLDGSLSHIIVKKTFFWIGMISNLLSRHIARNTFFRIGMILMALAENGSRTQRNSAPAVLIGIQPNILGRG